MASGPWIAVQSIQTKLHVILCKGLGHQEIGVFKEDPWIQSHADRGMTAYLLFLYSGELRGSPPQAC